LAISATWQQNACVASLEVPISTRTLPAGLPVDGEVTLEDTSSASVVIFSSDSGLSWVPMAGRRKSQNHLGEAGPSSTGETAESSRERLLTAACAQMVLCNARTKLRVLHALV
jgi:hypothetical protein